MPPIPSLPLDERLDDAPRHHEADPQEQAQEARGQEGLAPEARREEGEEEAEPEKVDSAESPPQGDDAKEATAEEVPIVLLEDRAPDYYSHGEFDTARAIQDYEALGFEVGLLVLKKKDAGLGPGGKKGHWEGGIFIPDLEQPDQPKPLKLIDRDTEVGHSCLSPTSASA